jgi:integrase
VTDRTLKALKPAPAGKRKVVWDALVPSLAVRVTDKGKRTFCLVKRFPGKAQPEYRAIGEYGAITLETARDKARGWIDLIGKGIDPAVAEAEERQRRADADEAARRAQSDTFAAALNLFVDTHLVKLRIGRDVERDMRRLLLPPWGSRPLASITRRDVIAVVYGLHDRGSPVMANRALAYTKKFYAWCVDRALLDTSPAALVRNPTKEIKRDRVLADHELREIWLACEHFGAAGRAVRLMLATGQRRGEVAGLRWSEIDEDGRTWRLPAERSKNGRAHAIPLSDLARSILAASPRIGAFAFSNDGTRPVNGWSKLKGRIDKAAPIGDWHIHDLRRACATGMARLGVDRVVIAAVLNHVDPSVTAVYDRHAREPEMRSALEAWGRRLSQIIDPTPVEVVPFVGRRK